MSEPLYTLPPLLRQESRAAGPRSRVRQKIIRASDGKANAKDNVLKNAPHTAEEVTADVWSHPYSREQAAYPLPYVRANKFWPAVARIDNPYGDRNLICSCPLIEAYETVEA